MRQTRSRDFTAILAALLFCVNLTPASNASAFASVRAGRESPVEARCAKRTGYERAAKRDSLDAYASVLQRAGDQTALTAGGRKYGESIVLVSAHGWMLRREIRSDADTYTLAPHPAHGRPSAAPTRTPRTRAGLTLGDPFANVSRVFGSGKSTRHCGRSVRAFAGPGTLGDWFAVYGSDARGRIGYIETGDVANGIRHLWEKAPAR